MVKVCGRWACVIDEAGFSFKSISTIGISMVYGALSPSFGSKKQGDFLLVFHLNIAVIV